MPVLSTVNHVQFFPPVSTREITARGSALTVTIWVAMVPVAKACLGKPKRKTIRTKIYLHLFIIPTPLAKANLSKYNFIIFLTAVQEKNVVFWLLSIF